MGRDQGEGDLTVRQGLVGGGITPIPAFAGAGFLAMTVSTAVLFTASCYKTDGTGGCISTL